jgi:hypothetical protein
MAFRQNSGPEPQPPMDEHVQRCEQQHTGDQHNMKMGLEYAAFE